MVSYKNNLLSWYGQDKKKFITNKRYVKCAAPDGNFGWPCHLLWNCQQKLEVNFIYGDARKNFEWKGKHTSTILTTGGKLVYSIVINCFKNLITFHCKIVTHFEHI